MKSLKFNHIEADNIRKGIQTATLRIRDDKSIAVNDVIAVIDKVSESDQASWVIIGKAEVTKVVEQKVGDLKLDGADFEKFGSMAELYEQLTIFYGDTIQPETIVKVIYFQFLGFEEPKQAIKSDVENSTIVVEMKLFGDGGSRGNPGPSASGFVLLDMENNILETNGEYLNITTNNQAEYHSLKLGLERAKQLGAEIVHVYMDSMLVINQMKGIYKVKNRDLLPVYLRVKELANNFKRVDFTHVPRELNKLADSEVNRILDSHQNMV